VKQRGNPEWLSYNAESRNYSKLLDKDNNSTMLFPVPSIALAHMSNEFEIIEKYFLPLTNGVKAAGLLADDVATIEIGKGKELLVSKDMMVEDIHFSKSYGAYNIACRLLKTNISDIAASGGKPLYYLLGFSQNEKSDEKFIKEFCRGLRDVGKEFGVSLIGGDSVSVKDKLCFSVTVFGEVKKGKALKRGAAQDGDLLFVSGNIGDAFLGLQLVQDKISCSNKNHKAALISRHLQPSPRIDLGMKLVKLGLSKSAIDISDGLFAELLHICKASKLEAVVEQRKIPISDAAKFCLSKNDNIDPSQLFCGGDDYELLFTASSSNRAKIETLSKKLGLKISCIGYLQKAIQSQIKLLDEDGQLIKIKNYGWQHY
jgi:thiamine-monophosphate kinase